jgi:hypothetical protein
MLNFMKTCLVGAENLHSDRHDETNSRCLQLRERSLSSWFSNRPETIPTIPARVF